MNEEIQRLPDLDHLIQALMEAKNRYGGNRPIVVETPDDANWYEGVRIQCDDEENENGPVKVELISTPMKTL